MSTALGVAPDQSGQGCDALTHRRIIASQWANTGVITGLDVSGRQDLHYGVSTGAAVCSMGEADGMSIAYWDGGGSPYTENAVDAGDATYPRIDAVYIISHTGSPDNLVHVLVKQGTPSASPVAPQVEAGGLVLGLMRMPAGATSTETAVSCGPTDYAIPVGASLGRLGYVQSLVSGSMDWSRGTDGSGLWQRQLSLTTSYLPTDRLADVVWTWRASTTASGVGSYRCDLYVDDVRVSDGLDECAVFQPWSKQAVRWRIVLAGGKAHQVRIDAKPAIDRARWQWQGLRSLEIMDAGVAR